MAGLALGAYWAYLGGRPTLGSPVWLGTLLVGGIPLVFGTVRRLLHGQYASDIIAALAIGAAVARDQAFAGVIIVLMQSGGEALDRYAFHRASSSLDALLQRAPRPALRKTGAGIEEVQVEEVRPGDLVTVRTGDIISVDGDIVSAFAVLDESAVTAEPLRRRRQTGEAIRSGSMNVGTAFEFRATRLSRESQYAKIVDLVRTAQARKPAIQRMADRYAVWFTPMTIGLAVVAALFTHSAITTLAVLVVATPCPLILATPIAVVGAINRASDRGLVVKSGAAMEELGQARAVLFHKTGPITSGRPEVREVVGFGSTRAEDLLRYAGAVEQLSSHPLAEAVVREARARLPDLPSATQPHEFAGAGIAATVGGHRILVGSSRLCATESRPAARTEPAALPSLEPGAGHVASFALIDGVPVGAIVFADRLRPEVPALTARRSELGIRHVGLVTGDSRSNAEEMARRAGIRSVSAELLPEADVEPVREIRRRVGSTVMVGDGIHDAAAPVTASVGVAVGP
jgi:heavy metal translocating P-type ATPase